MMQSIDQEASGNSDRLRNVIVLFSLPSIVIDIALSENRNQPGRRLQKWLGGIGANRQDSMTARSIGSGEKSLTVRRLLTKLQ